MFRSHILTSWSVCVTETCSRKKTSFCVAFVWSALLVTGQPIFPLQLNNLPAFKKSNVAHRVHKHTDLIYILCKINPLKTLLTYISSNSILILRSHPCQRVLIGLLSASSPTRLCNQLSVPTKNTVASHIITSSSSSSSSCLTTASSKDSSPRNAV